MRWLLYKINRLWNCLYAHVCGYFWLPCPLCKKKFGGHEWEVTLMTSSTCGEGVCPYCEEEAKRRNKLLFVGLSNG